MSSPRKPISPLASLLAVAALAFCALSASAQTVSTLYSFNPTGSAGFPLLVTPAQGRDGNLYGTTYGPAGTAGTVFRDDLVTGRVTELATFGANGSNPGAGLFLNTDGYYYGTTANGGAFGFGVLFKVTFGGKVTVLHNFAGGSDGAYPYAQPILASDGNLYGTTSGVSGQSTVYRLTPSGVFLTILALTDTEYIEAPILQAQDGTLYAVSRLRGGNGAIYQMTTSGALLWTYDFPGGAGGLDPIGPLVQTADGFLYGTTTQGGTGGGGAGNGVVFKIDAAKSVSVLAALQDGSGAGNFPAAGLCLGTDGNLYGVTEAGGIHSGGALFQVTRSGAVTALYSFTKGSNPAAALVQQTNGKFYGTTYSGGKYAAGSIYSLDMGLGPFISLQKYQGKVGNTVQVLGQGFTGTASVTFNGVPAISFAVVSDTYMTAMVPSGATTGNVVVTTPTGPLTSNKPFTVNP